MKTSQYTYKIVEAICVANSIHTSIFRSEELHENVVIKNETISPGVLTKSITDDGRVKIGTKTKIIIFSYPNGGTSAFVNDPARERKTENAETPNYGIEGVAHENKSTLKHAPKNKKDLNPLLEEAPSQYRIIATELSAMANARVGSYELTIGVDDEGNPVGIQQEVSSTTAAESELRNYLSMILGVQYTSQLNFVWEEPKSAGGKQLLVLRILGQKYTGTYPLLVGGTYAYVRSGSNSQRLSGIDLINFIKTF